MLLIRITGGRMKFRLLLSIVAAFVAIVGFPQKADAALVFHSGFEGGNTFEWSSVVGTVTVQSAIKKTGSYAMRVQSTTTAGAYVVPSAMTIKRFSFYIYPAALPLVGMNIFGGDYPDLR